MEKPNRDISRPDDTQTNEEDSVEVRYLKKALDFIEQAIENRRSKEITDRCLNNVLNNLLKSNDNELYI
jgi:hypothetical protein